MRSRASASRRAAIWAAAETLRGRLPPHYGQGHFENRVNQALTSGLRILDAGSGRHPTISVRDRPVDCHYVGLDLAMSELERAPQGSYDEMIAGDITRHIKGFEARFDLIVCHQVLEHVKPLDQAIDNFRSYLCPGGRLVAQMSGAFSVFGLANRLLPNRIAVWTLSTLVGRAPESVFPAYYHHCWDSALQRMLDSWSKADVIPVWEGAAYFAFLKPLMATYVAYEMWALSADHRNLASHYVVDARR